MICREGGAEPGERYGSGPLQHEHCHVPSVQLFKEAAMQRGDWVPPHGELYMAPRQVGTLQEPQFRVLACCAAGLRTGSGAPAAFGQADCPVIEAGRTTEASGGGSGTALARDAISRGATNINQRNDFIGISLRRKVPGSRPFLLP
jgi:hypothetical protein